MIHVYGERNKPSEWVKCELLHEFLECYQISFRDPNTGKEIEKIVKRDLVREVWDTEGRQYG